MHRWAAGYNCSRLLLILSETFYSDPSGTVNALYAAIGLPAQPYLLAKDAQQRTIIKGSGVRNQGFGYAGMTVSSYLGQQQHPWLHPYRFNKLSRAGVRGALFPS